MISACVKFIEKNENYKKIYEIILNYLNEIKAKHMLYIVLNEI